MTLVEFVLARVAEREAAAGAALRDVISDEGKTYGSWGAFGDAVMANAPGQYVWVATQDPRIGSDTAVAAHIALNDPATVLARCAVDRQIVALHRLYDDRPYRETPCCQRCTAGGEYPADDAWTDEQNWPCPTLRALASLDAGHPDYDESWRP